MCGITASNSCVQQTLVSQVLPGFFPYKLHPPFLPCLWCSPVHAHNLCVIITRVSSRFPEGLFRGSLEAFWINVSPPAGGLEGLLGKRSGLGIKTKQPQCQQRAKSRSGGRWLLGRDFSENYGEKRKVLPKLCFEAFWPAVVWESLHLHCEQ